MIDQNAPSCAWIGVEVAPMTAPVANSLGMAVPYGAIFDRPEAGSPMPFAQAAGRALRERVFGRWLPAQFGQHKL
jgi:S1-C subfamily serine protease